MREIVNQNLAGYTAQKGGADSLLYFGRKHSPSMSFHLVFGESNTSNAYSIELHGTDDNTFTIWNEIAYYHERERYSMPYSRLVSHISKESMLENVNHIATKQVTRDLNSYRVYHFHDISDTASVKGSCNIEDNRVLSSQAENLPAFLYWMQEKAPEHFANVESAIRQIAPFFEGFRLAPSRLNEEQIRLEWRERGSDAYFNATSLSDGTLRFICLATLLLQPKLPAVVLLDEPELGLHPAAITLLSVLLSAASERAQVIVASQSVTLVNQLDPSDVWTVDREDGQSIFRNLDETNKEQWLEHYALGEMWEKNLLGARP